MTPQFLVLVSLDATTKEPDQTPLSKASQGLKDKGIKVYSVGIKPRVDQEDLEDTTSKPSNVYIVAADQLAKTGRRIADTLNGYVKDSNRESGECHSAVCELLFAIHQHCHYCSPRHYHHCRCYCHSCPYHSFCCCHCHLFCCIRWKKFVLSVIFL